MERILSDDGDAVGNRNCATSGVGDEGDHTIIGRKSELGLHQGGPRQQQQVRGGENFQGTSIHRSFRLLRFRFSGLSLR
jgi:hypothetical protein